MELELQEDKGSLSFEREHNLGRMPLRIDFLVIRKKPEAVIKNEIGTFFQADNLFEYKSPGDEINAGTFFKVMSYAYLYQSERYNGKQFGEMSRGK